MIWIYTFNKNKTISCGGPLYGKEQPAALCYSLKKKKKKVPAIWRPKEHHSLLASVRGIGACNYVWHMHQESLNLSKKTVNIKSAVADWGETDSSAVQLLTASPEKCLSP